MSSFYQKYCLWVTSNFSQSHCQNLTLPNLKYSQEGLELFWKNSAERERSGVAPHCNEWCIQQRLNQPACLYPVHKSHPHLAKRSRMNSPPTSFALIWNLDKNPIKGGHPWVITGSLANHKGESPQAAVAKARRRSTAPGENRTQTRAHCVCYLLLHNEPSHSLGRVSGVQPLSPRPAFDLTGG